MNRLTFKSVTSLLILTLTTSPSSCFMSKTAVPNSTGEPVAAASQQAASTTAGTFSADELDELLAPIALYPDPLLAQLLPAATFIDQIDEAQRTLNGKSDDNLIADKSWDISVKSVAHYPEVLKMMNQKRDWTTALGQAYVNQSTDVEKAIQRLRAEAKNAGNLVSNDKMLVETKTESGQQVIVVEPAQPQVIYVPQYNPEVVYVQQPGPSTGAVLLAFGVGMAMGAWLNRGWNWYGGGIYYHGWRGGGWVGRSSTYVNVNVHRNVYVNNSYNRVNVNRNINNRNINNYRGNLSRDANIRRDRVNNRNLGRDNNRRDSGGFNDSRNDALRSKDNKNLDNYRGRDNDNKDRNPRAANTREATRPNAGGKDVNRPAKASSNSAFSANKSGGEVKRHQDRGSQSRQAAHSGGGGGANRGGRGGGRASRGGGGRRH